jgi:hypothetical protein
MKMQSIPLIAVLALGILTATAEDIVTSGKISGKVVETMDTSGYTYVLVDTGGKKVWAAATQFAVKVGDNASFMATDPMVNYHSKSLNRDFDFVYFTGEIDVNAANASDAAVKPTLPPGHPALNTAAAPLPPGHPPIGGDKAPATLPPGHPAINGKAAAAKPSLDLSNIKRADGGKTIAEIFSGQAKLSSKSVTVRGKVVKYNAQILGKNWLHIQDGSGDADKGNNDLTVTTTTEAKLGDTVLVTGVLSLNKDFGAGYKYALILDGATVTVE